MKKYIVLFLASLTALCCAAGDNMHRAYEVTINNELAPKIYHIATMRASDHRSTFGMVIRKYPGQDKLLVNCARFYPNGKPFVIEYKADMQVRKTYRLDVKFSDGTAQMLLDGKVMKTKSYQSGFKNGSPRKPKADAALTVKEVDVSAATPTAALSSAAGTPVQADVTRTGTGDMTLKFKFSLLKPFDPAIPKATNHDIIRATDRRSVFGVVIRQYPGRKKQLFNVTRFAPDGKYSVVQFDHEFIPGKEYAVEIVFKGSEATIALDGEVKDKRPALPRYHDGTFRKITPGSLIEVKEIFFLKDDPGAAAETAASLSPAAGEKSNWKISGSGLKCTELSDGKLKLEYSGNGKSRAVFRWLAPCTASAAGQHIRARGEFRVIQREFGSMLRLRLNQNPQPSVLTMSGDRYQSPLMQCRPAGKAAKFDFSTRAKIGTSYFFTMEFYGNAQTLILENIQLTAEHISRSGRPPRNPEKRDFDLKAVQASLEKLPPAAYELKRGAGRVDLYLNGKKMTPVIYRRGPFYPWWTRYAEFRDAGIDLCYIFAYFGPLSSAHASGIGNMWQGKNKFDFTTLRNELLTLHAINPDARVIIAAVMDVYPEWGNENPDAIFTNAKGEKGVAHTTGKRLCYGEKEVAEAKKQMPSTEFGPAPSYYSATFRRDMVNAFAELVKFLESDPAGKIVCGIHVCGGADSQFFPIDRDNTRGEDHSPEGKAAWSGYLRQTYRNDVNLLRQAWNDPAATFENPGIPGNTERGNDNSGTPTTRRGQDYVFFTSYMHKKIRLDIFRSIKHHSRNRLMTGCYYPPGTSGNYHLTEMLDSPDVDFIIDIQRLAPAGSMLLRSKWYIGEADMRVPDVMKPIGNYVFDWQEFRNILFQTAANITQREGGAYHLFDIGEAYYSNPETIKFFKTLREAHDAALNSELSVRPGIGVFFAFSALAGHPYRAADHLIRLMKYSTRQTLEHSGIPFQVWTFEDIFNPAVNLPPVVYIPLVPAISAAQAEQIRARAAASNSVIVWGFHRPLNFGTVDIAGYTLDYPERDALSPLLVNGKVYGQSYTVGSLNGDFTAIYERPARITLRPGDEVIGRYANDNMPGLIKRSVNGKIEYFNGAPGAFSPEFFRNIAQSRGVQALSASDDLVVMAENGLLSVLCERSGKYTVNIPAGFTVERALTGQNFELKNGTLSIEAKMDFEVFYFKLK